MIKGLYETHITVRSLEKGIAFYSSLPGLTLAHVEEKRRIAFFWIGQPQQYMLGLWEDAIAHQPRHFAFRCDKEFILHEAVSFLSERGLKPYNFLKDETGQPMVFAWMPAIAIYFRDPDENVLEFIAILEGTPEPARGVLSYNEWLKTGTV